MLTLDDVIAGYGGGDVLQGVDLHCADGSVTCIVGPNGAGKSTVLRVISGLLKRRGRHDRRWAARGSTGWRRTRSCALGITQVPQSQALFPPMSVRENVLIGGYLIRRRPEAAAPSGTTPVARAHPDRRRTRPRHGRQPLRRPAPDGRDRPLPDARPEAAAARRAVARPRPAEPGRRGRADPAASTAAARRCCWSSRTSGSVSAWPPTAW